EIMEQRALVLQLVALPLLAALQAFVCLVNVPTAIAAYQLAHPSITTSRLPSFAEITDGLPLVVKHVLGEVAPAILVLPDGGSTAAVNNLPQLAPERHALPLAVFGNFGGQVDYVLGHIRPAQFL